MIFKDFGMPYEVNDLDVQNFLQDFDINHDHEITIEDFKGVDILHFDLHQQNEMRVYWKIYDFLLLCNLPNRNCIIMNKISIKIILFTKWFIYLSIKFKLIF